MKQSKVLYNASFLLRPDKPVGTPEELRALFDAVLKEIWPPLTLEPPSEAFDGELEKQFNDFLSQPEWKKPLEDPEAKGFVLESSSLLLGDDKYHAARRFLALPCPVESMPNCSDRGVIDDIGMRTDWKEKCIRVSINSVMQYSPFAGFGPEFPKENLKIPILLLAILSVPGLSCDLSIKKPPEDSDEVIEYPLEFAPRFVKTEEAAHRLAASIRDPRRPVCLVLYFGISPRSKREAGVVAESAALKSHVYLVDADERVLAPIRRALPGWNIDRDVRERSCRVLFPFPEYFDADDANPRYRMAWPRRMSMTDRLSRIVNGLQRFFSQEDPNGLIGLRDLHRRLLRTHADESKNYASLAEREAEEADQIAKEKEAEAALAIIECNKLRSRIDDLETTLAFANEDKARLEETNDSLRQIAEEYGKLLAKRGVPEKDVPQLPEVVPVFKDLIDVLNWARTHFPNLEILDSAFPHARDLDDRNPTEGYRMLKDMNDILHPLLKKAGAGSGSSSVEIAHEFNDQSDFDLSFSEGGQTKMSKSYERKRTLRVRGTNYVFWPHVRSISRGDDRLIRAYFCYDQEADKILIGFFGKHLTTAGTGRMK